MSQYRYINHTDKAIGKVPAYDQVVSQEPIPALDALVSESLECLVNGVSTVYEAPVAVPSPVPTPTPPPAPAAVLA